MTESTTSWGSALAQLRQWAGECDGVLLTPTSLTVAADQRDAFYGRVETIQRLLAAEVLGEDIVRAEHLAEALRAVRQRLSERTGLARYGLPSRLEQFADEPAMTLARPLQGLVIDAASGAVGFSQVESATRETLGQTFEVLVRNAYEAWAYLSVLEALKPVQFWAVASDGAEGARALESDEVRVGWQVPSRELRVPEAVVRTEAGEYFAVKTECAREIDYYDALAPLARDTSAGGNTEKLLAHRVLLLYRLENENQVRPVVDRRRKVQVPCDLAVTVLGPREMSNPAYLGAFVNRARKLRMRRALQVVAYDDEGAFPPAMAEDPLAPPVQRHVVGLEAAALAPLIAVLRQEATINPIPNQFAKEQI